MANKALVVGGSSGIGLALVLDLLERGYSHVTIVGKTAANLAEVPVSLRIPFQTKTTSLVLNLANCQYGLFDKIIDIDTLIITAGFGRVAPFENLTEAEITNLIKVNELAAIQIIKKYYDKLRSKERFNCAVMGSIAGHIVSPLFSVYGATKMALCGFIESINAELRVAGCGNRILDVSPGSINGTKFGGNVNDILQIMELAHTIVDKMLLSETLYIPQYDEVFKSIINCYHKDPDKYAMESYNYKKESGRLASKPQVVIGYMSGTFDLFHIGHLNIISRAKEQCDYLVIGVHKSGAWKGKETFIPFEERKTIIESIKYVDEAIESFIEDSDAWEKVHYSKLFVGGDYKGSERFQKYEKYFQDKGVEIVYFPYTTGTSSTQLRDALSNTVGCC